jgi:hypothetical protein
MHQPRAPGTRPKSKHHVAEWLISREMMDHALRAIRARARLDREYDIPYVAGYSNDGTVIYIDRHMPKSLVYRSKRILTDRFLVVHEAVEKALIHLWGMHYLHAHQVALRAEQAAVRAEGLDWHVYDTFMQENIKIIGDETLTRVPAELDLTPYVDEHEVELMRKMRANMVPVAAASAKAIGRY